MPPEPANHGVLQRTLQQEQRKEIASDGDDIAERIERNKQILQLNPQGLREKEEADDIFGIAALFGNKNEYSRKLHHQAATHAQQIQRFAVALGQHRKDRGDEQKPDKQKQPKLLLRDNLNRLIHSRIERQSMKAGNPKPPVRDRPRDGVPHIPPISLYVRDFRGKLLFLQQRH